MEKKNIHVIPTDKPSRLFYNVGGGLLYTTYKNYNGVNLYIASDEEIKEGDYWLYVCPINGLDYGENNNPIVKNNLPPTWFEKLHDKGNYKKIIITTDKDLISDGVRAIDDEFLEWFVKNPSCEFVEINFSLVSGSFKYKIIIPQEEPKQETLEEFAEKVSRAFDNDNYKALMDLVKDGANFQAERMYNEEEVILYTDYVLMCSAEKTLKIPLQPKQWFEKFKKK